MKPPLRPSRGGVLMGCLVLAGMVFAGDSRGQESPHGAALLRERLESQLRATNLTVQELDLRLAPGEIDPALDLPPDEVTADLDLDGHPYRVELEPYSLRSGAFRVLVHDGGRQEEVSVGPPRTYRGDVFHRLTGQKVGRIHASVSDQQIRGLLSVDDHPTGPGLWGLQPTNQLVADTPHTSHVVFRPQDGTVAGVCGNPVSFGLEPVGGGAGTRDSGDNVCEIFVEIESAVTQAMGNGRFKGAERFGENLINDVELLFEVSGIDITFLISYTVVRIQPSDDRYSGTNPNLVLTQFENLWNNIDPPTANRCVSLLLTGTIFNGSTVSFSRAGTSCASQDAYGMAYAIGSSDPFLALIAAHTVGHMWGATDCDGDPDCGVMCSLISFCASTGEFGSSATAQISARKAAVSCDFPDVWKPAVPYTDDFETAGGSLDPDLWVWNNGTIVEDSPFAEPSGSNALKFNAAGGGSRYKQDELRTATLGLRNYQSQGICISFYYAQTGMEAGESLQIKKYTIARFFKLVDSVVSDGVDDTGFTFHNIYLPPHDNGIWAQSQFMLRFQGNQFNDWHYIDDFSVTPGACLLFSETPPSLSRDDHRQDASRRQVPLRAVGIEPGSRVLFFAQAGEGTGISRVIPLGEDIAGRDHAAVTWVTLPLRTGPLTVTFCAFAIGAQGRVTPISPRTETLGR